MAKKSHNEVAVGITVLVVLVLAVYIVVTLADWSDLITQHQSITVRLPYQMGLKGLANGSPILMGGAKIGQIKKTWIDKPDTASADGKDIHVYFTMIIPAKYELRNDCILSPFSNLLGGQASLVIKSVGEKGAVLKDGDTVDLALEAGITDAIDSLKRELNADDPKSVLYRIKYELDRANTNSIIASVAHTVDNLKDITDKIKVQVTDDAEKQTLMAKVHNILDKIYSITEQLNHQMDDKTDDAALAKLHKSLDSLNNALTEVDDLVKTNKTPVTEAIASVNKSAKALETSLPEVIALVKSALEKANVAMDNAKVALANIKEMLAVNRDSVDSIIRNVNEVSVNLKLASREIRRAPWKLLYKPKAGELHIQSVVDAAGNFASGAEQLDEASLRLKALMDMAATEADVDKKRLESVLSDLETSFDNFHKAEKKLWDELD